MGSLSRKLQRAQEKAARGQRRRQKKPGQPNRKERREYEFRKGKWKDWPRE